jgi:hypothetical protein
MKRFALLAAPLAGVFIVVSCARPPIERAIKRDLLPSEANVVVTNHCQGCHVHAKFDADAHMVFMKQKFAADSPLREAGECLECHVLKLENYFRKEFRATTRPHGQLVQMSDVPKPVVGKKEKTRGTPIKKAPVKKKKKWYFFYLF